MPEAHAYNPSGSGSRDQEDHCLKPSWANSSQDPTLKNPHRKRASGVVQAVGPEFCMLSSSPSMPNNNNNKKKNSHSIIE
jgi:hypothetical protein